MRTILLLIASILTCIFASSVLAGERYENKAALAGVSETKVYFDVNIGEPAKLLTRLQLIETTYNQLVASGASASFVIGIRGKASNFFTRDDGYVLNEDLEVKKKMAAKVEQFKSAGFLLEQCKIAADIQKIEAGDFLPQIELVANGYVSMIGYQSKGYAFVPMD